MNEDGRDKEQVNQTPVVSSRMRMNEDVYMITTET
jgi:hypothetical protein